MQLIIVEDKPWKLMDSILAMKKANLNVSTMVYHVCDKNDLDEEWQEDIRKKMEELGVEMVTTHDETFRNTMKTYYANSENVILFDFDLVGGERIVFNQRINVIFAQEMAKETGRNPPDRILFYTTAREETVEQINRYFPERNIRVVEISDNKHNKQVILDIDGIKEAMDKFEQKKA
jgi:hypothetical protein